LWQGGAALILGNEARGLSKDVCEYVESWIRLPIVGKAESLNVAVAGGVLMYAWLRESLEKEV
jgi:TrmH family RNA methyltransferase